MMSGGTNSSIPADFGSRRLQELSPSRASPARNNNINNNSSHSSPNQPTRLEMLTRCRKGKDFAGESVDPDPSSPVGTFKVTSGVIGYFGHLPGVQSSFGTSFPSQIKKSTQYSSEREKVFGKSMPKLDGDGLHDKWGNLKERPDQLRRDIGNLYIQASQPGLELDTSKGVGVRAKVGASVLDDLRSSSPSPSSVSPQANCRHNRSVPSVVGGSSRGGGFSPYGGGVSASQIEQTFFQNVVDQKKKQDIQQQSPHRSQAFLSKSAAVPTPISGMDSHHPGGGATMIRPPQPQHIVGYKGFQPGARVQYGEPYNRLEGRLQAASQQNEQARRYGPNRGVGAALASNSIGNNASGVITESESQKFLGSYEQYNLVISNQNAVSH